ncbi:MAG: SET domain-containing protein [Pseudomonadota bacterium]
MGWNVEVEFRASSVHGTGVYAAEKIPAGTKVWTVDHTMSFFDRETLSALDRPLLEKVLHGGYYHQPSGRFVWYTDGSQYINHAPGPHANIGIRQWTPLMEDHCAAFRDIAPGEELFEDYNFWSIFRLQEDHWVRGLYQEHCHDHYAFMSSAFIRQEAA